MADTEEEGIVRVFAWPRGTPLPANYVDGMAGMIEGDDDFEYDEFVADEFLVLVVAGRNVPVMLHLELVPVTLDRGCDSLLRSLPHAHDRLVRRWLRVVLMD